MVRLTLVLVLAAIAAACESEPPAQPDTQPTASAWPGEDWTRSSPDAEGLDSRAIEALDEEFRAGEHGFVDSMLIIRDGRLAFEAHYEHDYEARNADLVSGESGPWNYYDVNWHPYYDGSKLHTIQSSTKSVASALVGIAIAQGHISGVDATLGELLPHRNISDPQKAAITLDNILTMRPGFEWEEDVSYWDPRNDAIQVELTDDWVAYLLDKPLVHAQGTTYKYNSTNTQLLSEIVSTATGRSLQDYAKEFLFSPIGIENFFWKDAPEGFKDVAGGLYFEPGDFARFALLYQRNGEWNGRQVVPADWVRASSTAFVADTAPESPDFDVGYGYQWWVYEHGTDDTPYMYGTWGWGGQFALIVPELDLIGVFTGWNVYEDSDHEYAYRLFYDRVVLPAVQAASAGDTAATTRDNISAAETFEPAYSFARNQEQHRRFPDNDIWWTAYGPDQEWNFRNLHQFFPTVNVYRGGQISELPERPNTAIAETMVDTPNGPMPFDELLHSDLTTTFGVIVLHKGEIVYESYPGMRDYEMPVYWSVAKQFVGTVVRILEERSEIDVSLPIEHYIPELGKSDFAGITVRNILDMASGLDCGDGDYSDWDSCYYRYSMTIGDGFRTADAEDNPYDFAANLSGTRVMEQGQQFSYSGLNTFVLAWLVEKVTGSSFQDVLSKEIWYHIGAESNASYIAPRYGIAMTHGGFLARLRDVARYGLLFTPSYSVVSDSKIISDEHVEFLWSGGRPELLTNAGAAGVASTGVKHNIYQWDMISTNGNYYKGGWAGQGLMVNPERDLVAVFASHMKADESEVPIGPVIFEVLDKVYGGAAD